MTGTIIYSILIALGTAMIFMLTLRALFFDAYKEADPMEIDAVVARVKRGERLWALGDLGWLQPLILDARNDLVVLRRLIEEFRSKVERFHPIMVVTANTAMGVGFFGTVASIASMAGGKVDLPTIVGVGMQTTMAGLAIAQPGIAFHGLTDGKVQRFLDQIDTVLEALDGRINPPTLPDPVPSPDGPSNDGERRHGQSLSNLPSNDHLASDPCYAGGKRHQGVASQNSSTKHASADKAECGATAMVVSSDDFIGIVGWLIPTRWSWKRPRPQSRKPRSALWSFGCKSIRRRLASRRWTVN